MSEMIRVGMADYKLCAPPDKISTLGLGSCMGVVIYDTKTKLLKENLRAKIAGGAKMFAHHSDNELLNVGHHNNQAVRKFLQEKNIPIVADDSGKDFSRTIVFDPECELLHISVAGVNEYVI